jgi:WD40 repeat protein
VVAAGLVLLVLIGGIVGTVWQAADATRERDAKQKALGRSQLLSAELAFDKGQLLGEGGEAGLALLWLARSLKLAPPDAVQLQATIRTNLGAWQRQANSLRLALPPNGRAVAFAPDGKLMTASWDEETKVLSVWRWDPVTGQPGEPLTFQGAGGLSALPAFSAQADYLFCGFGDGSYGVMDLATGRPVWKDREKGGSARSAAFSPDGKTVLIGYTLVTPGSLPEAGKARLHDAVSGKPIGPALGHERPVIAVAFHPDGKSFVTECGLWGNGTEKVAARFWNLTGREIREPLGHPCMAPAVAFSPDGTKLLTGHWDYKARLWDLAAPEEPVVLRHGSPILSLAVSKDGQTLLTGAANCSVRLWDSRGRPLGPALPQGHQVQAARFSPDGKSILVGTRGNGARLWDLATDTRAGRAEPPEGTFFPLAFSPNRKTILTRDAQYTVQLRNATTGQPLGSPMRHQRPVLIAGSSVPPGQPHACSSDGHRALTVDGDGVARLWDTQAGELIIRLRSLPEETFVTAAFSPDGKVLVTGNFNRAASVWDAATGQLIGKLEHESGEWVFQVAFHPDGRMLLTGGTDGAARFWDSGSKEPLGRPLLHDSTVFALAFSPNGEMVLTGDVEQNAHLWDVATRRRLFRLSGHRAYINEAAFSPDGRLVLTGSEDHTARLWDVAGGKPIGPPLPHPAPVVRVAFGHDGQTVLTATEDQIARSWLVPATMTGTAEQIELWAQVATGMELEADGSVRVLDAAGWQSRRRELKGLETKPNE